MVGHRTCDLQVVGSSPGWAPLRSGLVLHCNYVASSETKYTMELLTATVKLTRLALNRIRTTCKSVYIPFFCSSNFDLHPITLPYGSDLDILKLYMHTKKSVDQGFRKLEHEQDIQTDIQRHTVSECECVGFNVPLDT